MDVEGAREGFRSELNDFRSDANDLRPASASSVVLPSWLTAGVSDLVEGVGVPDLGLSALAPGIFDLIDPLNDRADSRVSDLENEGYESSEGPDSAFGVLLPSLFPLFEG